MRKMAEMPYHIGMKVKLYLSNEQKRLVAINAGAMRSVYNFLVSVNNEKYRLSKTANYVPADRERIEYLQSIVANPKSIHNALPYLNEKEVDSQTVANAIKNYRTAWKNQKEQHTGVPTYKRKSYEISYQTNAHYYINKAGEETSNVRIEDKNHITLPKLGRVRFGGSPKLVQALRERKADTRIGTITISRDSVGEYWASFSIASEEPFHTPLPKTGSAVGIDLNLLDLANDSNGNSVQSMKFYKTSLAALAKKQHKLSRMQTKAKRDGRKLYNSKNYQQQRRKTALLHRRVLRQRDDYLHRISKQEIESQDFIAVENLKVKNLMKNHHLAGAIADVSWGKFLTMLQYKAKLYDKQVVLVPPGNTTQTCSNCGYVMTGEQKLTLADRSWICPSCGVFHDRDVNAAKNILYRGLQVAMQPTL